MATEEASLIEAVTSGTAFQPRNNEDFNQLGLIRLKIEAEKLKCLVKAGLLPPPQ